MDEYIEDGVVPVYLLDRENTAHTTVLSSQQSAVSSTKQIGMNNH
ncbi:unnamed protein product [Rhodiola kirilowii]